jgi:anti-anti-sigma factor
VGLNDAWDEDPRNQFGAEIRDEDGFVVLALRGEIDIAVQDALRDAVDEAVAGARRLTIDLGRVTFMGAVGVGEIVRAHQALGQLKEAVTLRSVPASLRKVLAITGLDRLVSIQPERVIGGLELLRVAAVSDVGRSYALAVVR